MDGLHWRRPNKMPWAKVTAIAMLVLTLSGCATAPEAGPSATLSRSWGIGIQVPQALPGPAAWQEGPSEIAKLDEFLRNDVRVMVESCGHSEAHADLLRAWKQGDAMGAFDVIYLACSPDTNGEAQNLANQAREHHSEQAEFERLTRRAQEAMESLLARPEFEAGPGSLLDAEILNRFFSLHNSFVSMREIANTTFSAYLADNRSVPNLLTAFDNLLSIPPSQGITFRLLDAFPWTAGQCGSPSIDSLFQSISSRLERAIRIAGSYSDQDDANFVTNMYGSLVKGTKPAIEFYKTHGWWPGLVASSGELDWKLAFWENYTTEVLPSREEGRYLISLYRSEQRNLISEGPVLSLLSQVDSGEWEASEIPGLRALTLSGLHWEFDAVRCGA